MPGQGKTPTPVAVAQLAGSIGFSVFSTLREISDAIKRQRERERLKKLLNQQMLRKAG